MANAVVFSDLHGSEEALSFIVDKAVGNGAEYLISAGDLCPYSLAFQERLLGQSFTYVGARGNCDSLWDFRDLGLPIPSESVTLEIGGRQVFVTHGHRIWEPPPYLKRGDVFISGHTHVPLLRRNERGAICLNPGSIAYPRGTEGSTYAIITESGIRVLRAKDDRAVYSLEF